MNILEKIDNQINEIDRRIPKMQKWLCDSGHVKWIDVNDDFDICNICGSRKAKKVKGQIKMLDKI